MYILGCQNGVQRSLDRDCKWRVVSANTDPAFARATHAHSTLLHVYANQTRQTSMHLNPSVSLLHRSSKALPLCTAWLLTGVDFVSWFKLEHGAEPGMVQEGACGVALRENGNHEAWV